MSHPKRLHDILRTMTPEEFAAYQPITEEEINAALLLGWNDRCDAEGTPWRKLKAYPSEAHNAAPFKLAAVEPAPIPMHLWCPLCHAQHFDEGEFATRSHKTHTCQKCGLHWQPALVPTVGVRFLPGCKNADSTSQGDFLKNSTANQSDRVPSVESPTGERGPSR